MERYASSRRAIAVMAVFLSALVFASYRWVGSFQRDRADVPILHPSDLEGKGVDIPSLPSIQMHLIPRTQATPLSPVLEWKAPSSESMPRPAVH